MTNTADKMMNNSTIPSEFPERGRIGMFGLIAAESAIFAIFVVAYLFYLGKSLAGPTPKEVLKAPIFYTICLLSSSITIHLAVRRLRQGRALAFAIFWLATIALGGAFLWGTASEWHRLIYGTF
jgi:cytochrome c oxidase subunit 3/cytochrome o ubiquinol oxidase subunit 3